MEQQTMEDMGAARAWSSKPWQQRMIFPCWLDNIWDKDVYVADFGGLDMDLRVEKGHRKGIRWRETSRTRSVN